jgi:putrescine transport system ATP-binding protein
VSFNASFLTVRGLRKAFDGTPVLRDVDLSLDARQTMSILGRSGSGKTTLLRILAGLESADAGAITLDGRPLGDVPARDRGAVYLYQESLLFPHLSVAENVGFGLTLQTHNAQDIDAEVGTMIERLGLEAHADKMPHQLSGGQQQRVAFGRAAILRPKLLLLDEPFANLDVAIRGQMQALFRDLADAYAITALFVTHNLKEALLMGDRLAHLREGRLKTFASRQEFVDDPAVGVREEMDFWTDLREETT